MKTRIISSVCMCLASTALSQGTIHFANDASSVISFSHSVPVNPVPIAPFGGSVQLAWASEGAEWRPYVWGLDTWETKLPGWHVLPGSITKIGATPGQFDGGTFTISTSIPGGTVQLVILSWTGDAASFDDAAFKDMSSPFTIDTSNPLAGETPASIVGPGKFPGFVIAVVPEPSSMALFGLGGAMLLFRRRMHA